MAEGTACSLTPCVWHLPLAQPRRYLAGYRGSSYGEGCGWVCSGALVLLVGQSNTRQPYLSLQWKVSDKMLTLHFITANLYKWQQQQELDRRRASVERCFSIFLCPPQKSLIWDTQKRQQRCCADRRFLAASDNTEPSSACGFISEKHPFEQENERCCVFLSASTALIITIMIL